MSMDEQYLNDLYQYLLRFPGLEVRGLAEYPTFPTSIPIMGNKTHVAPLERRDDPPPPSIYYEAITFRDVAPDSNELESREWDLYEGEDVEDDADDEDSFHEQSVSNPPGEVLIMANGNIEEAGHMLAFLARAPQIIITLMEELRVARGQVAVLEAERGDAGIQHIIRAHAGDMLPGTSVTQAMEDIVIQWYAAQEMGN